MCMRVCECEGATTCVSLNVTGNENVVILFCNFSNSFSFLVDEASIETSRMIIVLSTFNELISPF